MGMNLPDWAAGILAIAVFAGFVWAVKTKPWEKKKK